MRIHSLLGIFADIFAMARVCVDGGLGIRIAEVHEPTDDCLPCDCLKIVLGNAKEVGIEVMQIPQPRNIEDVLKQLGEPVEREQPKQQVGRSRHLVGTLGDEDIRHALTPWKSAVIYAIGQKHAKSNHKSKYGMVKNAREDDGPEAPAIEICVCLSEKDVEVLNVCPSPHCLIIWVGEDERTSLLGGIIPRAIVLIGSATACWRYVPS